MPTATESASPAKRKPRSSRSKSHPTPEQIQLRAYEIYLERDGAPGNEFEDWVRAEGELLDQRKPKSPKSTRATRSKAR